MPCHLYRSQRYAECSMEELVITLILVFMGEETQRVEVKILPLVVVQVEYKHVLLQVIL